MLSNQELLEMWKEDMTYKRLAESTIYENVTTMQKFFDETEDRPAAEVTKRVLDGYIHGLTKQNGEKMNISTKAKKQSHFKNFFNWLYDSDEPEIDEMLIYVDANGKERDRKNPVNNWENVLASRAAKAERNPRKEGLTEEEAGRFLRTVKTYAEEYKGARKALAYRDYAMVLLMIEIGTRVSDVINMNRSNFDLYHRTVVYNVKKTKSVKSVKISVELAQALNEYWDLLDDKNNIAFCSYSGIRMKTNEINDRIKKYAVMADIDKPMSAHILRHTCGSLLYNASNGNMMIVKEVLGHGSITTSQIYAYSEEINDDISAKTADITNNLVANW